MFKLRRLEERIVLDGAAIVEALDQIQDQQAHGELMEQYQAPDDAHAVDHLGADIGDGPDVADVPAVLDAPDHAGVHVLVISSDISDADDLAAAAKDDVIVVRYDASTTDLDALSDLIEEALDGKQADSIAFATHTGGESYQFDLTRTDKVDPFVLQNDANMQQFWKDIGNVLSDDGRIDLLACNVADSDVGQSMVDQIAQLAHADVAASTNLTGNAAHGGDWVMESGGGDVSGVYFDADRLEAFDGVLAYPQVGTPIDYVEYDYNHGGGFYTKWTIPSSAFTDADGDTYANGRLSYAAMYDQNEMSFSGDTFYFFSDKADHDAAHSTDVVVRAWDAGGSPISNYAEQSFTVYPNYHPTVGTTISDFSVNETETYTKWQIPANAFTDADGDTLTYVALYDQGWMSFAGDTFYFFPDDGKTISSTQITIRAFDQFGTPVSLYAEQTFNVTPVFLNDSPVLVTTTGHQLPNIPEDISPAANTGQSINNIIIGTNSSITDEDGVAVEAIAVTAVDDTNGSWEFYNSAGKYWQTISGVSDANAVLLDPNDMIRFQPNPDFIGTATFTFRAWDMSSGTAESFADTQGGGNRTAFSAETGTAIITVDNSPDAPTLDATKSPMLTTITEDPTSNPGTTVADIVVNGSIQDTDLTPPTSAPENIAITQVNNTNGTWQYNVSGTWQNFPANLGADNALLLDSGDLVRFVPNANYNGGSSFQFRAWDPDPIYGLSAGTFVDTTINGGSTAFSAATDLAYIQVSAVNDAPTVTATANTQVAATSSTISLGGNLITIADVDAGTGDVLVTLTASDGTLNITDTTGLTAWTAGPATTFTMTGTVSEVNNALNSLQYTAPATTGPETVTISANDQGNTPAPALNSPTNGVINIDVLAQNKAPTFTGVTTPAGVYEDGTLDIDFTVNDEPQPPDNDLYMTFQVNNGTLDVASPQAGLEIGGVGTNYVTMMGTLTELNDAINQLAYSPTADWYGNDSLHVFIDDQGHDGVGGNMTSTVDIAIQVSAVNDAPVLDTSPSPVLPDVAEDSTAPAGVDVATLLPGTDDVIYDVDIAATGGTEPEAIAITGITADTTQGIWQYDNGGGWTTIGTSVSDAAALLLDSNDKIRFVPFSNYSSLTTPVNNLDFNGTATFTYRAWDMSQGTSGSYVDASVNGGTTAFSADSDTASVTVTPVNDAPWLISSGGQMSPISESISDADNMGDAIENLITDGNMTDPYDTTGTIPEAVVITGVETGSGQWQYSTDGGTSWNNINSNVSTSYGLLLGPSTLIRFDPTYPGYPGDGTETFSFHAWDQSTGTEGSYVFVGTGGGSTAYSSSSDTASILVTTVNDAPVLNTTYTPTLSTITEDISDAANSGNVVSDFIASGSITDADVTSGPQFHGIAITGVNDTNGTWEYSTNSGTSWSAVGTVSENNALLLYNSSNFKLRFNPDNNYAGDATFTFRAWDGSDGAMAGTYANITATGGTTPFSAASDTGYITVSAVNDAPTMDTTQSPALTPIMEDNTASAGNTIADIIPPGMISDVDVTAGSPTESIAITAVDSANGTWQYSTDGGATWTTIPSNLGQTNALVLDSTSSVRFQPNAGYSGDATFTFRAWDETDGATTGSTQDTNANRGAQPADTIAYSFEQDTASITVNPVNDAPVLNNTGYHPLTSVTEDIADASNTGMKVQDIIIDNFTDQDLVSVANPNGDITAESIAITAVDDDNGVWQYKTGSSSWQNIDPGPSGTISDDYALLLGPDDYIRFVPNPDFYTSSGAPAETLTFRAWDGTGGLFKFQYVDTTPNGGSTPFSTAVGYMSVTVSPTNDAPVLDPGYTPTITAIDEDILDSNNTGNTVSEIVADGSITDVDITAGTAPEAIAVIGADTTGGTWQYSSPGSGWIDFNPNISDSYALVLEATTPVRFNPDANWSGNASFTFRAWDMSQPTTGGGQYTSANVNGGMTAFSSASDSVTITVNPVNDAPNLDTSQSPTLTAIDENISDADNTGMTVAQIVVDNSITDDDFTPNTLATESIAITSVGTVGGQWQYQKSGSSTWVNIDNDRLNNQSQALLLNPDDKVRFNPTPGTGADSSFDFRAWDGTIVPNDGNYYTTSAVLTMGGSYAFSVQEDTATIVVNSVNDAPVLDANYSPSLPMINEDINQATNTGAAVSSIIADGSISDAEAGGTLANADEAMAIIGVDNSKGTWQYWTGTSWANIDDGSLSVNHALLLNADDMIRFQPNADFNTDSTGIQPSFDFVAWDQSSGTAMTYVDATGGGTTAFSVTSDSATIYVSEVNDAPVLDTSGTPTLSPIDEGFTANTGNTVAQIVTDGSITDVDLITGINPSGVGPEQIAITGVSSTDSGNWAYNTGSGWVTLGASLSDAQALILDATSSIRFQPAGDFNGTATFSFRAYDDTNATAVGNFANVTTNGGSSAYSVDTEIATITVNPINDAPVLATQGITLSSIDEDIADASNTGVVVSDIIPDGNITDADLVSPTNPTGLGVEAIAVTGADYDHGKWQYSLDGTTWNDMPTSISDDNALLLNPDDMLRFVPNPDFYHTSGTDYETLTFRAWDQSDGLSAGQFADTTPNGDGTAYSTATETVNIQVTATNDPPVLNPAYTPTMASIAEDILDSNNTGSTVAAMVVDGSITDVDVTAGTAPEAIAVVGVSTTGGSWQWSMPGTGWVDIEDGWGISDGHALLLNATSNIRFSPDANWNGTATLTFRAWDNQTAGTTGGYVDVTPTSGNTNSVSADTDTVNVVVNPVNDAPVQTMASPTLPTINEDISPASNMGVTVADLVPGNITDVDVANAPEAIAITGVGTVGGQWQYSVDGGNNWININNVSTSAALMLDPDARIRFQPIAGQGENSTFTYRAWDQSTGAQGGFANVEANRGTAPTDTIAFSSQENTASIVVNPVNNAPVLDTTHTNPVVLNQIDEDISLASNTGTLVRDFVVDGTITDVDTTTPPEAIAITAVDNTYGTWQYYNTITSTWTPINDGALSEGHSLLLGQNDQIRFVPNADFNSEFPTISRPSVTFRAWDQSSGTQYGYADTTLNGGSYAFSTATDDATIYVSEINDAPALDANQTPVVPFSINEDATAAWLTANAAAQVQEIVVDGSITDVDYAAPAAQNIAITGVENTTHGFWYANWGTGWKMLDGSQSVANALALPATASMTFVPAANFSGDATFTFRAWDGEDMTNTGGSNVNTTINGGTTYFSTSTDVATITVNPINDAPVLASSTISMTAISEDITDASNTGMAVSDIVVNNSITDADLVDPTTNPNGYGPESIAITSFDYANGEWQYSVDGGLSWNDINEGLVTDDNALLLDSTDRIRFVPNADFYHTSATLNESFTFRAWDKTQGFAGGFMDANPNGGQSPFSTAASIVNIHVNPVNDAPVLDDSYTPTMTAIAEDIADTANAGNVISNIVVDNSITDVDVSVGSAPESIAITGISTEGGVWQYSAGGAAWINVDNGLGLSDANALLLSETSSIRFMPNANYNGNATFTFRAWDGNSGSEGQWVSVVANGGQTAFSTATDTVTLTVNPVNDAPVIGVVSPGTFTPISEDVTAATNNGNTVAEIVPDGSITDVDVTTVPESIAITNVDNSNGEWQYQREGNTNWTPINDGLLSDSHALLLDSGDRIRFMPVTQSSMTADIEFRAWDKTDGTRYSYVNVDTNRGTVPSDTIAYSSNSNTASISVIGVNDAPVLNTTYSPSLNTIVEDQTDVTNTGTFVGDILVDGSITDADGVATEAMVIDWVETTNGTWQYSLDGTNWNNIDDGNLGVGHALTLDAGDLIRFRPNADFNGSASFSFAAWDKSDGTAHGTYVDINVRGGSTAFSQDTDGATIVVSPVNDAPVLDTAADHLMTPIMEDSGTAANMGDTVAAIVATGSITDVDIPGVDTTPGIAITALDGTTSGTWYYSTNGGTNWTAIDAATINNGNALALTSTDSINFVPYSNFNGTASFTFRAWDEATPWSVGGTTYDTTINGGSTAFSTATDTATITVNPVNDAPLLTTVGRTIGSVYEDITSANNMGWAVSDVIVDGNMTDVDYNPVTAVPEALAINYVSNNTTAGNWEYSTDGGATWAVIGSGGPSVTDSHALLLDANDRIRFNPTADYPGTMAFGSASFTFRAWDQTEPIPADSGQYFDLTQTFAGRPDSIGGQSAFSTNVDTAFITVDPVNDAPVLADASPTLIPIYEDILDSNNTGTLVSNIVVDGSITDADVSAPPAPESIAIISVSTEGGTWEYSAAGIGWTAIDDGLGVAPERALLVTGTNSIRFNPDPDFNGTATFTFRAWDMTSGNDQWYADTTINGGSSAFSQATDMAVITVSAINDAPVLDTSPSPVLPDIDEDNISSAGVEVQQIVVDGSITDVDVTGTAPEAIAITGVQATTSGFWQYTTDGGNTWNTITSATDSTAVLLDPNDRIRFAPAQDWTGNATFTFRAWDMTSGVSGGTMDASTNGGSTAFSVASDTATITVNPLNDAPVLYTTYGHSLATIQEDVPEASNTGTSVGDFITDRSIYDADLVSPSNPGGFASVETPNQEAIAIVAVDNSNGTWQYSVDGTGPWTNIQDGSLAEGHALVLDANDMVRFLPNADVSHTSATDTENFTFRAWDQTDGSVSGTYVDTTLNGGNTAFSTATDTAGIHINPVNDAPVVPLQWFYVSENSTTGTQVKDAPGGADAVIQATDAETPDPTTLTYSIVTTGVPFTIGGANNNAILTTAQLDYETRDAYTITIRVTDSGGMYTDQVVKINVVNVEEGGAGSHTVLNPIPDASVANSDGWIYQFPTNTFSHDAEINYYSVANKPTWLNFSSTDRSFDFAPGTAVAGTYNIDVTANYSGGTPTTVTDTFQLIISWLDHSLMDALDMMDQVDDGFVLPADGHAIPVEQVHMLAQSGPVDGQVPVDPDLADTLAMLEADEANLPPQADGQDAGDPSDSVS